MSAIKLHRPFISWAAMEDTLREWHEQSLSDKEYDWLSFSFEDMADAVSKARFNASIEPTQPDNGWLDRQDKHEQKQRKAA